MTEGPRAAGRLERLLKPFAEVHAGEALDALLLMLSVFLLLTAYYVLKVVREPLILAGGGAELKSYTSAGQALLLLALVPAYSAYASRVNRVRLITGMTLFFTSNLVIFYLLALARVPALGVAFFVWVGIFNLMIVAQFWSFANDVYTPEQGRRLFAIVAFGQTLGAVLGGVVAKVLIAPLGIYQLLLVAAGLLLAYLTLTRVVNRRMLRRAGALEARAAEAPLDRRGGFDLVLRDRYLLLIGLLLLVLNVVNTNGVYMLGRFISQEAARLAAAGATNGLSVGEFERRFIGGFYADYFTWVNAVTAFVQLFLVSRVMKWFGVRVALYVLPLVAFGGYSLFAFAPILALIRVIKTAEDSLDYSLNNTARQALFLPTSREAKYKAKAAIDTLFVRAGDLLSAGVVFLGALWTFRIRDFAFVNLALVSVWLLIVIAIGRRHRAFGVDAPPSAPLK